MNSNPGTIICNDVKTHSRASLNKITDFKHLKMHGRASLHITHKTLNPKI
jgi:hypothetical protein